MAVTVTMGFAGQPRPSVPSLAIQWDRQGSFVWRIDDNAAHRVPVQIIARRSGEVTVAGELTPGDQVVVEGVLRLREGAQVVTGSQAGSGSSPDRPDTPPGPGEAAARDGGRSG
jgi:multidrug efflux pump subunit AcrA (membrane-fusion protein)